MPNKNKIQNFKENRLAIKLKFGQRMFLTKF